VRAGAGNAAAATAAGIGRDRRIRTWLPTDRSVDARQRCSAASGGGADRRPVDARGTRARVPTRRTRVCLRGPDGYPVTSTDPVSSTPRRSQAPAPARYRCSDVFGDTGFRGDHGETVTLSLEQPGMFDLLRRVGDGPADVATSRRGDGAGVGGASGGEGAFHAGLDLDQTSHWQPRQGDPWPHRTGLRATRSDHLSSRYPPRLAIMDSGALSFLMFIVGLVISYWVIRLAVRHAIQDADRRRAHNRS